jgi:dephospho-CoA kinase
MLLVGLTGGIGAGKSTVARMLQERGAVVVDADDLARQAIEPGTHGYAEVLRRFGPESVRLDGSLDREWLAKRVFTDPAARRDLEAITHPEVARLFAETAERYRDTGRTVVYVVPLLVEAGLLDMFEVVVTVEAPEELRIERLRADRGMSEEDARARIRAQLSDEERGRVATFVLRNDGDLDQLEREVARLLKRLGDRDENGGAERR